MKKKFVAIIIAIMLMIISTVALVGCMPFSVDNYLNKVNEKNNYTLVFDWETGGNYAKDYYYFTKNFFGVSTAFEYVADLRVKEEVVLYREMNNVWEKSKPISRKRYLEYMGFDEDGKFLPGNIQQSNARNKCIGFLQNALTLAATDLDNKFNVVERKYELRSDSYYDVFGSDSGVTCSVVVYLEDGDCRAQLVWGANKLDFTITDIGSTKLSITKEMSEARLGAFVN